MKNWILFNLVLLMMLVTGAAYAQVQMVAASSQSVRLALASQTLRDPASTKPVAKITDEDEIAGEMDAANNSAQATYQKRAAELQEQEPTPSLQLERSVQTPVQRPTLTRAQRPMQYRPTKTSKQQIDEGDYNPYKASPARHASTRPATRTRVQTQPVYREASAEQPRAQVAQAGSVPRPQYQAQPIQLSPTPSQVQQYPENQAAGYPAEQDWRPAARRTGVTLLPTLNLGIGMTSADYISDSVQNVSVTHQTKFIYGGGLMAEFGRSTFTVETGLLYLNEQINASYTTNFFNTTSNNASLGYMGVPVLAKLNLSVIPHRSRLSISGGVIPAILIYSKFDYVTQNNGFQTDISNPNDAGLGLGGFRTFNVFGTAAIGGDFAVGPHSDVRAELAYRRALMSLTQNQNTFEDVFLLNVSFGFDVSLFSRVPAQPGPAYQTAPNQIP